MDVAGGELVTSFIAKPEAMWDHLFQPKHSIQRASAFVSSSSRHQMDGPAGVMQDFNRMIEGEKWGREDG